MANIEVFYSKKSDDWRTPSDLYKAFMDNGYIDPCPYQSEFNGLEKDYKGQYLFINPPFSKMKDWIDYGIKQFKDNVSVVFLIPARTDTKYFHKLLAYTPRIYFIEGRLHYNDSEKKRSFP